MFPIRDHNPSDRTPWVTWALLLTNVVVFVATYPGASEPQLGALFYTWGIIPAEMFQPEARLTWISHMFLHAGWMHLIGNMLFLWIFGDNVEDQLGHFGFFGFYLLSGFAAAYAQYLPTPQSGAPMVGASGAIAGVMGGYWLLFPRARVDLVLIVLVFVRMFSVPAWVVLGGWLVMQGAAGLWLSDSAEGVAYWAHFGGFVAGIALIFPLWLRRGGRRFWARFGGQPPHPPLSLSQVRVPPVGRKRQ